MNVSEEQSERYIAEQAQGVPFKFIDRVVYLDDAYVVTELYAQARPYRFVAREQIDNYAILEFVAQSSGLILRGKKRPGTRCVISSFDDVKCEPLDSLRFPLRLEARLLNKRMSFYEFHFHVFAGVKRVVEGCVNIFIEG